MGRWIKVLGVGLLAGLVAALFMTVVLVLLRLFSGVGLPAELGGDRFLPTLSVKEFLTLLGNNGGPIAAKRKALLSSFAGQLGVGVAFGVLYACIAELGRAQDAERPRPFGISIAGALFVGVTLVVIWAATLAVLWPTLGTNNRGLLPGLAVAVTAIGFLILYASYGVALIHRYITSSRPLRESAPVGEPIEVEAGEPVTLRGVALSGDKGISKVEVSTDVERSWDEANLDYAPSRIVWAFWSYEWRPESPGRHELVVRATDDDGNPQIGRKVNGIFDGATGYDTLTANVQG